LLSAPAAVPKTVASVPWNEPVEGPVSVRFSVSISPVTSLTTEIWTLSAAPGSVSRSASSTVMVSVSPGIAGSVALTVPSVPIGVVSCVA
jgi:hypothetical protein